MGNRCKFCDDYKRMKSQKRKFANEVNCDPETGFELRYTYKVVLTAFSAKRFSERSRFQNSGRCSYGAYPIRFCPVCGRKL